MKTLNTKTRIGSDGILNLNIPTTEKEVDVEVIIILQPQKNSKKNWPKGFFESTYGSLKNDPIERLSQGDYPEREQLL